MPLNPIFPTKLERLDVQGKGGWWKLFQAMAGPEKRREEFRRLIGNHRHEESGTIPKLRTLVDLGLWDDFMKDESILDKEPNPGLAKQFGQVIDSLFGNASLASVLKTPENEARRMFKALDWQKPQPIPMDIVHIVLEAGFDPDLCVGGARDHNLMAHLVNKGDNEQAMKVFKAGANPNLQAWAQESAMHILAGRGALKDIDMLRQLVEEGVDINNGGEIRNQAAMGQQLTTLIPPAQGGKAPPMSPPISMAIAAENLMVVKAMVEMGANLDWAGHTAFHAVADADVIKSPRHIRKFMEALLKWGGKIDEINHRGVTPLWLTIPHHPEKAKWLIEHGARADIRIYSQDPQYRDDPPQTLLEKLIVSDADLEVWKEVVDQIQQRFPECWSQPYSRPMEGVHTVADLAIWRGGMWAAQASAQLLENQVEISNTDGVSARPPRF